MARRAVIDRDELFEVADRLVAEGKDVTALALLNALGGGSLTTIYKYLAEWEAGRPKVSVTAPTAEVPQVVQNAFASTWKVATMEAARETVAVKEKAAEEVKEARKQFEGALSAIQKLEEESEADALTIESLRARVSELEAAVISAGNDNAALKATIEQLNQQVKSQQSEMDRLHKTIDEDRKHHYEELTQLKNTHAKERANLNDAIEKANTQLTELRVTADESARQLIERRSKLEQTETLVVEAREEIVHAKEKLEAANAQRESAMREAAEYKGQLQLLKGQNTDLIAKLAERNL